MSFNGKVEKRPPLPPFDYESATLKVQLAEEAWNSKNPQQVALAYTPDSLWRNRNQFLRGRQEIEEFLTQKWESELDYKLKKELWSYNFNRIAVRFFYEYRTKEEQWFRAYGNEMWEFASNGLMQKRFASINDIHINKNDRLL
ncbi:hypothetical protein SAMN05216474_0459 [Lishizhenia tianjinensis]|uniref:DUF4440 domain-containing protein n=1 Tax=Lishizhenia tianjinensis TaxID=477690 RepID=A0A1I6XU63_9FLAO|nr:nuclear transport factor 2 family protein [Lishizhenia tianjinensis]SFT41978.1 hypothetical protein SAMN05216474_0459 [Lishizhenia tianjinensis]